jgi:RimJ/RimL family protein N-acetyltransferase
MREFVTSDEQAVHAYASDSAVTRFLLWGPNTEADTRRFIAEAMASCESGDARTFDLAVIEKSSQRLIGGAALRIVDAGAARPEGEIGYVLNRDYWSRGYATEAAETMLRFGFGRLELRRIHATCDPENEASAAVLRKVGMTLDGRVGNRLLYARSSNGGQVSCWSTASVP